MGLLSADEIGTDTPPTLVVALMWCCYKCTKCYSYTITPGDVQREEEVSFLFFLLDGVGAGSKRLLQLQRMLQLHHLQQ